MDSLLVCKPIKTKEMIERLLEMFNPKNIETIRIDSPLEIKCGRQKRRERRKKPRR